MTRTLWLARRVVPWFLYHCARPIGRVLPPRVIVFLASPFVAAATALELLYAGPRFAEFDRLPAALRPQGRAGIWRERNRYHAAALMSYWSDLRPKPVWGRLVRVEGPRASVEAVESGARPVVLASLHYGPIALIHGVFRSRGVPMAVLSSSGRAGVPHLNRLNDRIDRAAGLAGVPRVFEPGALAEAIEFLRGGRVLVVFLSGGHGRQVAVVEDGVRLDLGPGALQAATMADAEVIPFLIRAGRQGTLTITLGEPLPPEEVRNGRRHREALGRFLRFCLPLIRSAPGQIDPWLLRALRPADPVEAAPPFVVLL